MIEFHTFTNGICKLYIKAKTKQFAQNTNSICCLICVHKNVCLCEGDGNVCYEWTKTKKYSLYVLLGENKIFMSCMPILETCEKFACYHTMTKSVKLPLFGTTFMQSFFFHTSWAPDILFSSFEYVIIKYFLRWCVC